MGAVQTEPLATSAEPALDLAILYRRERAFVRRVLLSLGVAASAVDDAIQDVFVVVFRRLRDYDQRRGTMRAWLFGIAMRVAAKQRRRARPKTLPVTLDVDDAALGDPERYVARLGAAAIADRLISAVPAEQWVPFVMAEVEGMTAPEIADALGLQVATVYTRIHRARRRLDRERKRMVEGPSTWWALLVARFDEWSRPRPLAMAAFVSLRMTIAIVLTVIALAALALFVARAPGRTDDATPPLPATSGATSVHAGGDARDDDAHDDLATAGPATIAGRVTTPAGPLADARVCAWPEPSIMTTRDDGPIACVHSQRDGHYELAGLRAGRWGVTASAIGWSPASHLPPAPASALVVRGGQRLEGIDIAFVEEGITQRIVVRDVLGGPIDGALVFAASRGGRAPQTWLTIPPSSAETNAEGVAELSLRPGSTSVRARAEGYADGTRDGLAPGPDIELVLAPESAIGGRVIASPDGEPVEGATVVATVQRGSVPERVALTTTDAEGHFRLSGLAPGDYRVQARKRGRYGETALALALGFAEHVDDVVIETTSVGSLHARVELPNGEPCRAGLTALLVNNAMLVDAASIGLDGTAEFEAVVPGSYQPYVLCFTAVSRESYPTIEVAGTESQTATWLVDAGATVQGRVLDPEGRPVPRAEVDLLGTGPGHQVITDDDGHYVMIGVANGTYQATARRSAMSTSGTTPLVVAGADAQLDLELLAPAKLSGRVVDRAGAPVAGAIVDATRDQHGTVGWQSGAGTSDGHGEFALDVDPGTWKVQASVDTVKSAANSVRVGVDAPTTIDLVVDARRGTVRGRVVQSDGSPVADAVVVAQSIDDPARGRIVLDALRENAELVRGRLTLTDDDGRFTLELRAGPHVVLARRRGGGEAWKLGAEIGQVLELAIPEESAIAGTVKTPDGGAPTRVSVRVAADELGLRREESFVLGRGAFRIEGLPAGKYVVTARAAEGVGRTEVTLAEGEVVERLAITLAAGGPKAGRFVDHDTGVPVEGIFASAGSTDDAPQELAMKAQIGIEIGDAKTKSDSEGRFTLTEVVGDTLRLVAVPAEFATSPYGIAMIELPAGESLPDVPLVRLRAGRDDAPGTFGLELGHSRRDICRATATVAAASGPAAATGVRVGDTITAIDGKDVTDWRCYLVAPLLTTKVGTSITVTLGRGDTVTLVSVAN